ncbi:MAG: antibiotic biosynthesis monooxygenase [Armatimonadetes bacterium]|nr:antibiotic biosynthesis monooxygenase [Armatimonadota bacterium]
MTVLTAYVSVHPEKIDAALELCRAVREASVKEAGCERYDFYQHTEDRSKIVFVEEWTSRSHLDTHFQQAAFKKFVDAMGDCFANPPEIRIFEATLA